MSVLKKIKNNAEKMKLSLVDKFKVFLVSSIYTIELSFILIIFAIPLYSILSGERLTVHNLILGFTASYLLSFIPLLKIFFNRIKEDRYIPNKNELEEYISSLNKVDKNTAVDLIIEKYIDNKNKINLKKLNEVDKKIKNMTDDEKINYLTFRQTMKSYLLKEDVKITEKELV